jgi:NADP-dependent aldehyde dehydrogenase
MGAGQFCTKPGISILPEGAAAQSFIADLRAALEAAPSGTLFGPGSAANISESLAAWVSHGASVVTGGRPKGPGFAFENTLAHVSGARFLEHRRALQTEAFGPVHLVVLAAHAEQMAAIAGALEGSLTGAIYSDRQGEDELLARAIEPRLRLRVGRLLNDKMPTGVAVSPAMNHGGPYPSTGHAGFTAVGIPASIRRFTALHCYDNVREPRLPPELRNHNALELWRSIDGEWTRQSI